MAKRFPSPPRDEDYSSQIDLQLCRIDQENPDSCTSSLCTCLHMCQDYLLTKKCSEFDHTGKCIRPHSLFTHHNARIIKTKLKLLPNDRDAFDLVAKHIRTSRVSIQPSIPNDDNPLESSNKQANHVSIRRVYDRSRSVEPLRPTISCSNPLSTIVKPFSISRCAPLSLVNTDESHASFSKSMDLYADSRNMKKSLDLDDIDDRPNRHRASRYDLKTRHSMATFSPYDNDDQTYCSNENSAEIKSHRHDKSRSSITNSLLSKAKALIPNKGGSSKASKDDTQIKYLFSKYSQVEELAYLHGPIRHWINERQRYQIFASGYCRLADKNQEKQLQDYLNALLPRFLNSTNVQLPTDNFSLFIGSSACERILERNQTRYATISHTYSASVSIEVKRTEKQSHVKSSWIPPRRIVSPQPSTDRKLSHISIINDKLHISRTNSSITVIQDDITNVKVDMIVCVTTSVTLFENVLRKVDRIVRAEFIPGSVLSTPVICHGGYTQAQSILFTPWKLVAERSNPTEDQKSLTTFVKQCIDKAQQAHLKSIAFPSIGTGKIGLDSRTVSEAMINAAIEALQDRQMDVVFVIYPSTGDDVNQQSYRAFQNYLNYIGRQSRSLQIEASSDDKISLEVSQIITRSRKCDGISIVTDSSSVTRYQEQLLKLIKNLIEKKKFDLSLVNDTYKTEVNSLIDVCLDYHVLPYIDFSKNELILHGDSASCSQCFMNLRNSKRIHDYTITDTNDNKTRNIKLNMHVSMKIDEAFIVNQESKMDIEDGPNVFHVNLCNLTMEINDEKKPVRIFQTELNADQKIPRPGTWSSSQIIRTIDVSLIKSPIEEHRRFQKTMPITEWTVHQINAIENWPLYVRYSLQTKNAEDDIVFYACSYSSVQSIIHYGLHLNFKSPSGNTIHLTDDALNSHIQYACRASTGKYYMFAVRLPKKLLKHNSFEFSNENSHFVLPTYLIVYERKIIVQ